MLSGAVSKLRTPTYRASASYATRTSLRCEACSPLTGTRCTKPVAGAALRHTGSSSFPSRVMGAGSHCARMVGWADAAEAIAAHKRATANEKRDMNIREG